MNYLTYIFFAILIICTIIKLVIEIKKVGLRQYIVNSITYAESNIIYGANQEKFDYVYNRIYSMIPTILKPFFQEKKVKSFIQTIFDEVKIALDTKTKKK